MDVSCRTPPRRARSAPHRSQRGRQRRLEGGSWQAIISTTVTGTPDRIRDQLSAYARDGITEIVYQPAGPDIPGELERFITIARDV
jgi:alkanesulfonate monooxygenase SsuD/methylene tetrahydromethanopterin reductase-like flavin-dependent oxidoreductase (luciferase family)